MPLHRPLRVRRSTRYSAQEPCPLARSLSGLLQICRIDSWRRAQISKTFASAGVTVRS